MIGKFSDIIIKIPYDAEDKIPSEIFILACFNIKSIIISINKSKG